MEKSQTSSATHDLIQSYSRQRSHFVDVQTRRVSDAQDSWVSYQRGEFKRQPNDGKDSISRSPETVRSTFPCLSKELNEVIAKYEGKSEVQDCSNNIRSEPLRRERKRWFKPPDEPATKTFSPVLCPELPRNDVEEENHIRLNKMSSSGRPGNSGIKITTNENQSGFYKAMRSYVNNYSLPSLLSDSVEAEKQFGDLNPLPLKDPEEKGESASYNGSPVAVRVPSPSSVSSVTSGRRLEWDSGADVGYQASQQNQGELSTIERMALARGCSAALFVKEGEELISPIQHGQQIRHSSGMPFAESTRLEQISSLLQTESEGQLVPHFSSSDEYENEIKQRVLAKYRQQAKEEDVSSEKSFNLLLKKYSTSMSDLSVCDNQMENPGRSLPRSCSSLSLSGKEKNEDDDKSKKQPQTINGACSVSSSSVATIVQKQESSPIYTLTLPARSSVAVQTSSHSSSSEEVNIEHLSAVGHVSNAPQLSEGADFPDKSVITLFQSHKCTGAYKKGSCCSGHEHQEEVSTRRDGNKGEGHWSSPRNSEKVEAAESNHSGVDNQEQNFGTLDSVASSTQTARSWFAAETSRCDTGARAAGVVGSAHSFEYLPGHMYESNAVMSVSPDPQGPAREGSASENDIHCAPSRTDKSSSSNEASDKQWNNSSSSSSLAKDLEQGVKMLKKLVGGKAKNPELRKALIRHVVDHLVESDYTTDVASPSPKTNVTLQANVPWVPVQQGSSVPGGSPRKEMPEKPITEESTAHQADKCVGTVVSEVSITTGSSCAESGSISLPGDSRAETTSETSNPVHSSSEGSWRNVTTRSEREFQIQRHMPQHQLLKNRDGETLTNFCHTERRNQLHWICFEIDHLNKLKQLLEGQEGVKKSLISLTSHKHAFQETKPALSGRSQHKPARSSSSSSTCGHVSFPKQYSTQTKEGILGKEDNSLWTSHEHMISESVKRDADTQVSIQSDRKQKEKVVPPSLTPTPTFDSCGTIVQKVVSLSDSTLDDNARNGKINVYHQTLGQRPAENKPGSRASTPEMNTKKSPICCCDTRKLLRELIENNGLDKAKSKVHDEGATVCRQCFMVKSRSGLHVSSPVVSNVSDDIATVDSKETFSGIRMISIATETTDTVAVQTTPSLTSLPVIQPVWFSRNLQEKEGKDQDAKTCSSCGLLSEATVSHPTDDRKHCRCNLPGRKRDQKDRQRKEKACPCYGAWLQDKENKSANSINSSCTSSLCSCKCCNKLRKDMGSTIQKDSGQTEKHCRCSKVVCDVKQRSDIPAINKDIQTDKVGSNVTRGSSEIPHFEKHCPCCGKCGGQQNDVPVVNREMQTDKTGISGSRRSSETPVSEKHCPCCSKVDGVVQRLGEVAAVNKELHAGKTGSFGSHRSSEIPVSEKEDSSFGCSGNKSVSSSINQSTPESLPVSVETRNEMDEQQQSTNATVMKFRKEPLAYILTFEPSKLKNVVPEKKNRKRRSLPVIKVKVPLLSENSVVKESEKIERLSKISDGINSERTEVIRSRLGSSRGKEDPSENYDSQEDDGSQYKRFKAPSLTLQEYLKANRPDYIACADKRRQCMMDLAFLREMRHKRRQELLALSKDSQPPSRPSTRTSSRTVLQDKPVFTRRMMRKQTKQIYQRTTEVKNKKAEKKKKEDYRTNRLMAEIFTKKLKKKVLQGTVNISNTESIISTL